MKKVFALIFFISIIITITTGSYADSTDENPIPSNFSGYWNFDAYTLTDQPQCITRFYVFVNNGSVQVMDGAILIRTAFSSKNNCPKEKYKEDIELVKYYCSDRKSEVISVLMHDWSGKSDSFNGDGSKETVYPNTRDDVGYSWWCR